MIRKQNIKFCALFSPPQTGWQAEKREVAGGLHSGTAQSIIALPGSKVQKLKTFTMNGPGKFAPVEFGNKTTGPGVLSNFEVSIPFCN